MGRSLSLVALLLIVMPAWGQISPPGRDPFGEPEFLKAFEEGADLTIEFSPAKAKPGDVVTLKLTISPKIQCWTYPVNVPEAQDAKNVIRLPSEGDVLFLPTITDPKGAKSKKSADGKGMDLYYPFEVTWEFKGIVHPATTPGKKTVELKNCRLQVCNAKNCVYTGQLAPLTADLEVLPGPASKVPAEFESLLAPPVKSAATPPGPVKGTPPESKKEEAPAGLVKKKAIPLSEYEAKLNDLLSRIEKQDVKREGGLLAFLTTAAAWGFISLLTPCVFPMIPITVSLFLKQSHQSTGGAVKLAAIYCATIVVVLGLSAIFLLSVFRAWSVSAWMNIGLGVLFVVLALSLFGMFDLTLPNFLLKYTEGKRKSGGLVGTVFGAIAFSIVSFTCVAPFLGGFAGMAASGNYSQFELILAGLTFAGAFAAPFFILALFPSLLKSLPKSGGWLDSVKVVMGFLEVAAALKFFRTAELRLVDQPVYFTYDLVLTGWVVTMVVTGLYLLNTFRLPHDEEKPSIGVPRLMFALLFLGLGIYLWPGTFKNTHGDHQRPAGVVFGWVDAFLLPEPNAANGEELPWGTDLPGAIESARKQKGLVFADFTGVTCTNCKDNEYNVFPLPQNRELMKKYSLVQMYTDTVPAAFFDVTPSQDARDSEATANLKFQKAAFGTEQLPLYVIFEPVGDRGVRIVGVYNEGKINDRAAFTAFLKSPLEAK